MERFRALSHFQPTNFNAAIGMANNEPHGEVKLQDHLFGAMLGIPHTQMARVVAMLGFDFIFVDTLHVPTNPETLASLIQTINFASEGKTVAIVRVPSPDSDLLPYALDSGAAGIVFPQIDTAAQAEAAVYRVRTAYGGGNRSVSPCALLNGVTNIAPEGWTSETIADRNITVICQIESALAMENIDAIAATPGVNTLMLGVGDLKATLGIPIRNPDGLFDESKFRAAMAKMAAVSRRTGIPLMMPSFRLKEGDVEFLRDFKMIVTSLDVLSVFEKHRLDIARMKEALGMGEEVTNGQQKGHENGIQNGHQVGLKNGHENGFQNCHQNGIQNGH